MMRSSWIGELDTGDPFSQSQAAYKLTPLTSNERYVVKAFRSIRPSHQGMRCQRPSVS
ncbi:protein of unknown function (plasmid) [Cupriavidus taiwanensis]|uniref:Uncharacterized protein n=1 Tax=Cupriavidus taiwanensis TaxID=164546 RepID=A0A375IW02_9BURK|nr:protein of unknown function [Cupriavidus taiwanensis]